MSTIVFSASFNASLSLIHILVILSSTPIPGNEKAVARVINELSMKGAEVINQDTHVSGHACQEEIKLMYSLVRPKFSIPVHGEYRHLMAQRNLCLLYTSRCV